MRVMISLEDRFFRTQDGSVYSNTTCDYKFWQRYLQVFDEVIVLARVCELPKEKLDKPTASGPNVSFIELPYYIGPKQFIKKFHKLNKVINQNLEKADCYILRIPGAISTRLWKHLNMSGKRYGVEVVGSSADSIKTAGVNWCLRKILSAIGPGNQRKQCLDAVASAYVSEFYLQREYPPGNWSTNYSSIDLPEDAIVDSEIIQNKIRSFKEIAESKRPLKICHAGTMEVAYKAQDVLLEAAAICRTRGLDVELAFLGEGRLSAYYVEKAKELEIEDHVSFLGMLPAGDAVRQQIDLADIFVLPSETEGLPRILIEAMARAIPCIATNVGGIPELLCEENMVGPGNSEALAEKILTVARDYNRMVKMSRRNLEVSKKYSKIELNRKRVEFYQRLIGEANG